MKSLFLILLILSCYNAYKIVQALLTEYYWRDFTGLLPTDAVPGGLDASGDITYIAQFSLPAEYNQDVSGIHTLVGTLRKGKDRAEAPYLGRTIYSNETSNLKVLCAAYLGRYKWYPLKSLYAPNCRLLIGGNEDGIPLYVGKAVQGREKLIGKLFSDTSVHSAKLISPYQGGEVTHETFEILTYCL
ncbi:hypothetical protein FQA39_LY03036 [Lamprigera yunnana]|nr:hypothetical protein FQA39_LY03036 [Lamprigera yunnana]